MRRGLVTSIGTPKHDKLVACAIKFLIKRCDASPLEIETEKEVKIGDKRVLIDVFWKGRHIECMASGHGLNEKKVEALYSNKIPIVLAVPRELKVTAISRRLIPAVKGILLFDLETEKLFKTFENLDEYLGYTVLDRMGKTIDINL